MKAIVKTSLFLGKRDDKGNVDPTTRFDKNGKEAIFMLPIAGKFP